MLFEQRLWPGLADGTVTVTFRRGDGPVYRVDFHHAGADPREALRQAADLPRRWPGCGRAWTASTGPAATAPGPWPPCA